METQMTRYPDSKDPRIYVLDIDLTLSRGFDI